jgi:peptide/nickel transport system substrate-binding protein
MGRVYESSSPDGFINHPFWTSASYVGAGPYRIVRWDPGSQLLFHAFDGYVLGRPKIDEVVFRIISDPNAVVANLLAGEAHVAINIALGQMAGATVRDQWAASGDGTVVAIPVRFRFIDIQRNPSALAQPALQDLRVRRALAHGIDRATLAEISTAGLAGPTDVFLSPQDQLYEAAVRGVPKYPYDVNRALALLRDAGSTRQGELLANAAGQQFTLDIFSSEGSDNETEAAILAADFRKLGMQVTETIYPRSLQGDREFRSKFAGLNPTALTIEVPQTLSAGLSDQCPDPNRRYAGGNRGCWTNPEFDQLYQVAGTSLDPVERNAAIIRAHQIMNEDVGKIPLAYRSDAIAFRKGVVGPGPRFPGVGDTWNIHEWRWQ